jgi:hypothetical protein
MRSSDSLTAKLNWWISHNKNVLFVGKHGVGKTAMVKEAFDQHGLKWRYFSAATMDPWVDFVGVPREKTEQKIPKEFEIIRELANVNREIAIQWVVNNWKLDVSAAQTVVQHAVERKEGLTHLDIVRPHDFASGEIEALFFDEFNRAPKKVRNATMELIQFKSINGHKFPKLRFIWAAINPDDNELNYDVEKIDPATLDRFIIPVEVPYKPNVEWFRIKYGQRLADSAVQWWDELSDEEKNKVSPRRLQYALDVFVEKGDVRDVLPVSSNVSKLITVLNTGPVTEKLDALLRARNDDDTRKFLSNENNFAAAIKYIPKASTLMEYFTPLMPKEKLASLIDTDEKVGSYIINNLDTVSVFNSLCHEMVDANLNAKVVKKIRRALTENEGLAKAYAQRTSTQTQAAPQHFNAVRANAKPWGTQLVALNNADFSSAANRSAIYEMIAQKIPAKLTVEEAGDTLVLFEKLFCDINSINDANEKGKWQFPSILTGFDKLMGMVNHCLYQIHQNTGQNLPKIIEEGKGKFGGLMTKIVNAGLRHHLPNDDFK